MLRILCRGEKESGNAQYCKWKIILKQYKFNANSIYIMKIMFIGKFIYRLIKSFDQLN
jgi:hypothetical protein